MAETPNQTPLLPSLLDRLIDDDPQNQKPDPRNLRGQSLQALRASVERDIAWLLNSGNLGRTVDLEKYPLIASSVLNYGIPQQSGKTASSIDVGTFEKLLRQSILEFEPRILRDSVKVRLDVDDSQMNHNAMVFSIEGELSAEPVPIHIILRAELDLETGDVHMRDRSDRETT